MNEDELHDLRMQIGNGAMDMAEAWDHDTMQAMTALFSAVQALADALEGHDVEAKKIAGLIAGCVAIQLQDIL